MAEWATGSRNLDEGVGLGYLVGGPRRVTINSQPETACTTRHHSPQPSTQSRAGSICTTWHGSPQLRADPPDVRPQSSEGGSAVAGTSSNPFGDLPPPPPLRPPPACPNPAHYPSAALRGRSDERGPARSRSKTRSASRAISAASSYSRASGEEADVTLREQDDDDDDYRAISNAALNGGEASDSRGKGQRPQLRAGRSLTRLQADRKAACNTARPSAPLVPSVTSTGAIRGNRGNLTVTYFNVGEPKIGSPLQEHHIAWLRNQPGMILIGSEVSESMEEGLKRETVEGVTAAEARSSGQRERKTSYKYLTLRLDLPKVASFIAVRDRCAHSLTLK